MSGSDHRKPPLHPGMPGRCRWCGEPTPPRARKDGTPHATQPQWHKECVREYHRAINTAGQVKALIKRDGRKCQACGCEQSNWGFEVDHIRPLWQSAGLELKERRAFFVLENLQLLCAPCHKEKSAREAKQRAKEARLRGETGQDRKWKRKIRSRNEWPQGRKIQSRPLRQPRFL